MYISLSPPGVWFGSFILSMAKCIHVQDAYISRNTAFISRDTGFVHLRWAKLCPHHLRACVLSTNVHLIPLQLAKCQRRERREGVWCPSFLSVESELHSLRLELSVTCRLQLSLLPCCALIYTLMFDLGQSCDGVSRCPPNARTTMHMPTEQQLFGVSAHECSSTAPGTNCLLYGADGTDW